MSVTAVPDTLLTDGLARIQREIDATFDALLPMPHDPRTRLVEAMRYATIGGGKRIRPLLVTATAEMYGVDRSMAARLICCGRWRGSSSKGIADVGRAGWGTDWRLSRHL